MYTCKPLGIERQAKGEVLEENVVQHQNICEMATSIKTAVWIHWILPFLPENGLKQGYDLS